MLASLFLFDNNLINIVTITFTALVLTELSNVAFEIHTWNRYMVLAEVVTVLTYFVSMVVFKTYFGELKICFFQITILDLSFIASWNFVWKVVVVTSISCIPLYVIRFIRRKIDPPSYLKLS